MRLDKSLVATFLIPPPPRPHPPENCILSNCVAQKWGFRVHNCQYNLKFASVYGVLEGFPAVFNREIGHLGKNWGKTGNFLSQSLTSPQCLVLIDRFK